MTVCVELAKKHLQDASRLKMKSEMKASLGTNKFIFFYG